MREGKTASGVLKFVASLVITVGAGTIAGLFSKNAAEIYGKLAKPSFAPPASLFAPVWTVLYILIGISLFLVWKADKTPAKKSAISYFLIQLVFNVLWSVFFFALELRVAALADLLILLLYAVITTVKFFRISKAAGALMLPYLLWIAFASVLNFAIVLQNG